MPPKHSIEARADRLQRRMTGPWRTVERGIGPVVLTTRYRRHPRIEWVRLWVAMHDLERAVLFTLVLPVSRMIVRLASMASPRGTKPPAS